MFSRVAVPAEQLETRFRPAQLFQRMVKAPSSNAAVPCELFAVVLAAAVNMVNGKESPISYSAANTMSAVGADHFLPKSIRHLALRFGVRGYARLTAALAWYHWSTSARRALAFFDAPCSIFASAAVLFFSTSLAQLVACRVPRIPTTHAAALLVELGAPRLVVYSCVHSMVSIPHYSGQSKGGHQRRWQPRRAAILEEPDEPIKHSSDEQAG